MLLLQVIKAIPIFYTCFKQYLNLKGIYLLAVQKDKCREKVWEKGVEFEEGKMDLSSKGLFPLLKSLPPLFSHNFFGCFYAVYGGGYYASGVAGTFAGYIEILT